jgi:hypothetical protein
MTTFIHTTCTSLNKYKDFLVLLELSPKFPFNSSNIAFVHVNALSFHDAGRIAIESINYDPITDCRPEVRTYFEAINN